MPKIFMILQLVVVLFTSTISYSVYAGNRSVCEVIDLIEMHQDGLERREASEQCEYVEDAPNCSVYKIYRMIDGGNDEDDIYESCSSARSSSFERSPYPNQNAIPMASFCFTNYGSCPLNLSGPIPVGSQCFCTGPWGSAYGIAR